MKMNMTQSNLLEIKFLFLLLEQNVWVVNKLHVCLVRRLHYRFKRRKALTFFAFQDQSGTSRTNNFVHGINVAEEVGADSISIVSHNFIQILTLFVCTLMHIIAAVNRNFLFQSWLRDGPLEKWWGWSKTKKKIYSQEKIRRKKIFPGIVQKKKFLPWKIGL